MAASKLTPTSLQRIQHERFITEKHGYQLWDLSLSLTGNIAVSGHHNNVRTFIDLYFGRNSDSRDKLKLFYSKEIEKYSGYPPWRYVSFFEENSSKVVSCIGDKIEILDTNNESKVTMIRSCRVNGKIITCLDVREGKICIGLSVSQTVIVFNNDLKETKKIKLKGIQDGDYPFDLQVIKDTVFVCTGRGKACVISESDGSTITQYTDTTGKNSRAYSITANERLGLVSVVWGMDRVIVYSLNENKSFLFFDVGPSVLRIRLSDKDRTMMTGNERTGEIKMYDLEQLFSFDAMKRTLAYIVSPDECEELRKYFGVTEEEMGRNLAGDEDKSNKLSEEEKTVKRMEYLLTIIEERGCLDAFNINHLKDAVSAISHGKFASSLQGPMEGYILHGFSKEDVLAEMMARQKSWEDERNQWSAKLRTTEMKTNEYEKTVEAKEGELQKMKNQLEEQEQTLRHQLEQTKQSLDSSREKIKTLTQELDQTRTESTETKERLTEELAGSTKEKEKLKLELHRTKQKLKTNIKEKEALHKDLEMKKEVLDQTTLERDVTRTELERYQLKFAKESKALKEVLNQTKQAMAEPQKGPVVGESFDDSEETRDGDMANIAAEFGRLTVAVAEHLTLDHCLKLAILFNVPASECDTVRRLSLVESPGMKFLDVLKKRQVINIFDVSNLQKGLAMLHLEVVNHDLIVPYQKSIDDEQYQLHKVEEMFSWEEVDAFVNVGKDDAESQTSPQDDSEHGEASRPGATGSWSESRVHDSGSHLADKHDHKLYTECSIGIEGGTIQVANVSLSIPPGALNESHVIALSVMNESPFPLDREVDTARMTPLIKLEPLALTFKKPLQLNIPHSALIPEPESHAVIIYSGQTNEDSSDSVTWTEERSIPRQLKEKSVTVDIQCLSYLSASLVSQTTAPHLYIVRAVPFVDGVRDADDDITLTVCFCSDNDAEYNMLMADYKTKLPLEQYSTLQLHRHSESHKDDAGFLSLTVTSVNDTYVPDTEQRVKRFAVSHLCTASRVSHQLRLKKNQDKDRAVVDIEITFSQVQYEPKRISLTARVKDLIISEESEKLLSGPISPGNKRYEDLVVNISSRLGTEQCRELSAFFQFTSEDTDMITFNQDPGKMLMKTLEERSVIDSQKMILFFEGLKACHLDETAELVSEYVGEISKKNQEKLRPEEDTELSKIQEETSHFFKDRPGVAQTVVTGLAKKLAEQLLFDISGVLFYII